MFEPWGVHVEIDGGQHTEVHAWWADMKRQNDLWIAGQRVLRFPAWVVRHRPREVIDTVRAALVAAGWRPTGQFAGTSPVSSPGSSQPWTSSVVGATPIVQDLRKRR